MLLADPGRTGGVTALFAAYAGGLGGAERVLLDHAVRAGTRAVVACPRGPLLDAARDAGLEAIALRERSLRLRGRAAPRAVAALAAHGWELRRAIAAAGADVVVLSGMRPALAGAAVPLGRAARVFLHQDLARGPPLARALRLTARRCDAVVALSEAIAADLGVPATVLHPGVDLTRFTPSPPPAEPRVLVLGALTAWKRPDLALEAVARIPEATVTLAGAAAPDDPHAAETGRALRERATRPDLAGRVTFAGPLDAPAALRDHAVLLHAADREPYGLALVEALAAGRPVVAPASAGPAEIVDATCGRLYAPGDAAAAANALTDALRDARPLGEAARTRAEQRFDVEHSAARLRAVLERVRG